MYVCVCVRHYLVYILLESLCKSYLCLYPDGRIHNVDSFNEDRIALLEKRDRRKERWEREKMERLLTLLN